MKTHVKVSGTVNNTKTAQTPANIVITQHTQRQLTPATDMKPLTMGPNEGPAKGASANKERAFPRVFASQISAMTALE